MQDTYNVLSINMTTDRNVYKRKPPRSPGNRCLVRCRPNLCQQQELQSGVYHIKRHCFEHIMLKLCSYFFKVCCEIDNVHLYLHYLL